MPNSNSRTFLWQLGSVKAQGGEASSKLRTAGNRLKGIRGLRLNRAFLCVNAHMTLSWRESLKSASAVRRCCSKFNLSEGVALSLSLSLLRAQPLRRVEGGMGRQRAGPQARSGKMRSILACYDEMLGMAERRNGRGLDPLRLRIARSAAAPRPNDLDSIHRGRRH